MQKRYKNEKDLLQIYEIVVAAAVCDLHWEVKAKAVEFWTDVIANCLHNQGMIDNAFPEMTFSMDSRKIIMLSETEIQKRLHKVLIELSQYGCLKVLMTAIQDDCDIDVVDKAVQVTKTFAELLKRYKIEPNRGDCVASSSASADYEIEKQKFLKLLQGDLDQHVRSKRKWMNDMDSFEMLLNDMLHDYEDVDNSNDLDCY